MNAYKYQQIWVWFYSIVLNTHRTVYSMCLTNILLKFLFKLSNSLQSDRYGMSPMSRLSFGALHHCLTGVGHSNISGRWACQRWSALSRIELGMPFASVKLDIERKFFFFFFDVDADPLRKRRLLSILLGVEVGYLALHFLSAWQSYHLLRSSIHLRLSYFLAGFPLWGSRAFDVQPLRWQPWF